MLDLALIAQSSVSDYLSGLLNSASVWGGVALGIGVVIFVHELGHFAAAKLFGVKCEKFYVGFDVPMPKIGPFQLPSTLGKFRYGETEYGIGILPLGGYVKMLGQDDDPRSLRPEATDEDGKPLPDPPMDPRSYRAQPVWQRMVIISAGVIMNIITGVLFAAIAFGMGVPYMPSQIGSVSPGGPAWTAGVEPGGRIVRVGRIEDERMSFRQMVSEIVTQGLDRPDEPITVAANYPDGRRQYELKLIENPIDPERKMVGIGMPDDVVLAAEDPAEIGSVAATVITEELAGGRIVAVDGRPLDVESNVPVLALTDRLYSRPAEPVELTISTAGDDNGSAERTVTLPPQPRIGLPVRYGIGPVSGLVDNGPAAQAGLQIGDVIETIEGEPVSDPFELAVRLVAVEDPVRLTVRRGVETVDVTVAPREALQTQSPIDEMTGSVGLQRIGLALKPTAVISGVEAAEAIEEGDDTLAAGDEIQAVRLVGDVDDLPADVRKMFGERALNTLADGWDIDDGRQNLILLDRALARLPVGTRVRIDAVRPPESVVVSQTVSIAEFDDAFAFTRGLNLQPEEQIKRAEDFGDAIALGLKEGWERFESVVEFLRLGLTGKLGLGHVGGPLTIATVAKNETEAGPSRLLTFLTLLSMNLAILNFLPIPALDGGHMMFLTYELVTGRKPNEAVEYRLTIVGFLLLISLMVLVFYQDVVRLVS